MMKRLLDRSFPFLDWLWYLATGLVVILFLLGVRPVAMAILASAPVPVSASMVTISRTLADQELISPALHALYAISIRTLTLVTLIPIGFLIVRKQRGEMANWFNWFAAFFILAFGATMAQEILAFGITVLRPSGFDATTEIINRLGWLLFVTFLYLFPDGRLAPRWSAFGLAAWWVLWFTPVPAPLAFILGVIALLIGVISLVYRYVRVATIRQRQQMKWVILGLILFLTLSISALILVSNTDLLNESNTLLSVIIPVSIGIAMVREQLWDVDVIIRKTLIYGVLMALLAIVYFGDVVLLQWLAGAVTDINQSPLVIVLSTLLIAALFSPLRRRLQDIIDRRFYRRKYDTEQILASFARVARDETDLDRLIASVLKNQLRRACIRPLRNYGCGRLRPSTNWISENHSRISTRPCAGIS